MKRHAHPLADETMARVRECVRRYRPAPPPLVPCPHCRSLYCGPIRCRFTMESNTEDRADRHVFLASVVAMAIVAGLIAGAHA